MRHGGSVMAPDAVLAVHYAREMYSRRQESVRLWVVRRADIHDLDDPDLLQPPLDRSFKKPGGYVMRDKLAAAREQSGQPKPKASAAKRDDRFDASLTPHATCRAEAPAPRPSTGCCSRWPTTSSCIGFSDSEWTGIAPMLEEDVAMSSLAQDELGHAQALYQLLAELRDDGRDADAIAYDRTPDEYRHARLLDHGRGDWAMTIARRYLYDTADTVRLEALAASSFGPLARARRQDPARGALPRHARDDVVRAARDREGEPRDRLLAALDELGPDAATVFTPLAERATDLLDESASIAEPMAALEARWRASRSRRRSSPIGLPMPPAARARTGRTRHGEPFRWLVERVHDGPPRRPGGGMVIDASRCATRATPRPCGPGRASATRRSRSSRSSTSGSSTASTVGGGGSRSSSSRRSSAARRSS